MTVKFKRNFNQNQFASLQRACTGGRNKKHGNKAGCLKNHLLVTQKLSVCFFVHEIVFPGNLFSVKGTDFKVDTVNILPGNEWGS